MTKMIHNYTAANSIDASADLLLIDPASSGIYKSISRNTLLALASQPLGLTDSQSPQNKTLDNTNSITVKDGSLTIQNTSSTTKQAVFSASGITAGQTRTFTFPDASGTLVTTAGTQTLTNKTVTSPTITGGTIDNSTVTVDSIAGHTVATTVTVANLQIANGVLNTANAVTATSIADGAIQPKALTAGTGSGWAWTSYTPTWTNLSVGNGVVNASYIQVGKLVFFKGIITWGNTTSVSGSVVQTLPVTSIAVDGQGRPLGTTKYFFAGTPYIGTITHLSTTTAVLRWLNASGSAQIETNLSSTSPNTWTTSTEFHWSGFYEAA